MNREYLLEQSGWSKTRSVGRTHWPGRGREAFLADKIAIDAAVRELTVLFETSHNIAKHVIASFGWREANSKAEAFEILAEQAVLSSELCDAFRQASRFRNLVTYQTAMVLDDVVYGILKDRVGDFETFVAQVGAWLARRKANAGGHSETPA